MQVYKDPGTSMYVERPIYQQDDLNRDTLYSKPSKSRTVANKIAHVCDSVKPIKCVQNTVPILKWLPHYEWGKWLFGDLVAGITITVMQIPQGMGYAMLGGVPPIVGIYMAFFPVLMYSIFGTSKHLSTGTFAIICLMTGKVVLERSTHDVLQNGTVVIHPHLSENDIKHPDVVLTNVEVAITVTFFVAVIQLVMYVLRLGILTNLFSDVLIKGLTTATSCHVVVSQLREILGLKITKRRGYFSLPLTLYDVGMTLHEVHLPSVIISAVTLIVIITYHLAIKNWLAKRSNIPFPIELFVVVVGTLFSFLNRNFQLLKDVSIVGYIPTGFPAVTLPSVSLIEDIWLDCFVIAMVSYAVTISMALLFARKRMYDVDSNQELLALGMGNVVGSLFGCMPTCASISRSLIQESVGGKTQLSSIFSCGLITFVLLWLAPLFEPLPKACLGTLIAAAIWPAVMQFTMITTYWKLSKWDAAIWLTAYSVTLFINIGLALGLGLALSLLSIFLQGYKPYACLLGVVPNTDLYLDLDRYKAVQEINQVKIFHYSGMLNFSSRQTFTDVFKKYVGFDPAKELKRIQYAEDHNLAYSEYESVNIKYIIIDFCALTYIDPAGVTLLRNLVRDCEEMGITVYFTGCSGPVFETIRKCDQLEKKQSDFLLFPTIHDAVIFAQHSEAIKSTKKAID